MPESSFRFLRVAICAFILTVASRSQAQDSTLAYTLKEKERIVYLDEHRLLITHTGIGHLLFIQRSTGYFILYNSKEYGPFEDIGFHESNVSLFDWKVKMNKKAYQLILDQGLLLGPYDDVVDVYRSNELSQSLDDTELSGTHFGFRSRRDTLHYANVDGKLYGPYKKELDNGTPFFVNNQGTIRVYLKYNYEYNSQTQTSRYWATGDTLVLGPSPVMQNNFSLQGKTIYRNGVELCSGIVAWRQDARGEHAFAIDSDGKVFIDGKHPDGIPAATLSTNIYPDGPFGFISTSGQYYYTTRSEGGYAVYLSNRKNSIGPFAATPGIYFTKDASHYAFIKGSNIMVDGNLVHRKGFSLVYNPGKDCFSWLSVSGRSIFIHHFKP